MTLEKSPHDLRVLKLFDSKLPIIVNFLKLINITQ